MREVTDASTAPVVREIWLHALAAKVGGGVTYLRHVLPEIARQLAGQNVRVVLLLPAPLDGVELPDGFTVHFLPRAAANFATRLFFDQVLLPLWLWPRRKRATLFCSASYAPLWKPAPTVVLLRNAIYFDENLLQRETPARRRTWRLQSWLIVAGARACRAVMYPTRAMRELAERAFPSLKPRGVVNHYGVSWQRAAGSRQRAAGSRQQAADSERIESRQQVASSRQQVASSRQQTAETDALPTARPLLSANDECRLANHVVTAIGTDLLPAACCLLPAARFLYVMTYTVQKNLRYLLQALILAKRESLPVQVVVTSHLTDCPPACHVADWQLITEHDLIGSGYLRPVGPTYGPRLQTLYQEVEACVFVSFCESFGHPLVEALALGKPLICADLPYSREICGDAACYVDLNRPEDLVEIWRTWPDAWRKAAPLDRDAFQARFSWPQHVAQLLQLLN